MADPSNTAPAANNTTSNPPTVPQLSPVITNFPKALIAQVGDASKIPPYVVYYAVAERETRSAVQKRKKILMLLSKASLYYLDATVSVPGAVVRVIPVMSIQSPLIYTKDPTTKFVAQILFRVADENDSLLTFSKFVTNPINDPNLSTGMKLIDNLRALLAVYNPDQHFTAKEVPIETELRKQASLNRVSLSPEEKIEALKQSAKKAITQPPVEKQPQAAPSVPTTEEENKPADQPQEQQLNNNSPTDEVKATPTTISSEPSPITVDDNNAVTGIEGPQMENWPSGQMEVLKRRVQELEAEKEELGRQNSFLQVKVEDLQYHIDATDPLAGTNAMGFEKQQSTTYTDFLKTVGAQEHTVEDFSKLVQQLLQVQRQLIVERQDREALIEEEKQKVVESYNMIILRQQDELSEMKGKLSEMEQVFHKMRCGVDGENAYAMSSTFVGSGGGGQISPIRGGAALQEKHPSIAKNVPLSEHLSPSFQREFHKMHPKTVSPAADHSMTHSVELHRGTKELKHRLMMDL